MKVIDVSEQNTRKVYNLMENRDLEVRLTGWDGKHIITDIEIISFWVDKKIEMVNYCKKTDAIEIHYYKASSKGSFIPNQKYNLGGCRLNCLRTLLLEYDKDENIEECSSSYATPLQPTVRQGNILIGNP